MKTILFLSEACLFDRKSGAALSARAMLQVLAQAGWSAQAATLTLCDGDPESPLAEAYPELDGRAHAGEWVLVADGPVLHHVLVTPSTRHKALRPKELRRFLERARELLLTLKPDVVLTYSSEALHPLLLEAQQRGAKTVFYVASAAYARRVDFAFRFIDTFLVPSQAMVDLYKAKLGIQAQVMRDMVPMLYDGKTNLEPMRITTRRTRYVTMVNPDPAKGGLFFLNLVVQVKALLPEVKFRVVESRWGRPEWAARGVDGSVLDMIDWQCNTGDMGRAYAEAALLLVPSLWFEPSARVVAEALLAGVPVLAMRSGGIAEQLNEGGFLFDVPVAMKTNFMASPPQADLNQWSQFVKVLMEDDAIYTSAVKLALKASQAHAPVKRAAEVVAAFAAISS